MPESIVDQTLPTRALAEKTARMLGCRGAHKMSDGWHPCESHDALLVLLRSGAAAYRTYRDRAVKSADTSKRVVVSQAVMDDRKKRNRRRRRFQSRFENLGEHGVGGLDGSGPGVTRTTFF